MSWEGTGVVGGGVSTFYTSGSGATLKTAAEAFFNAIKGHFPSPGNAWVVPSSGELVESTTSKVVGIWTAGTATSIGWTSSTPSYAAGVGARVVWETDTFVDGRKVRGSTFLVPLTSQFWDSGGTILDSAVTTLQNAAVAFRAAAPLVIVTRPTTKGGSDGGSAAVTSARVPDKVTWLKSRRT